MPLGASRPLVRNTVVMIVLAILAAATSIATWQRADLNEPTDLVAQAEPLRVFTRGARLTGTDEQGRPTYRIFAERLDELPGEERLQLTGVNVDYQPVDESAWSLTAAAAKYARDGSQLDLLGNVQVRSAPTDGSEPVTIVTEQLLFSPDTSSVESDESVEIRVGAWQLRAVGLRTLLKEDTLELESQVHGTLVQ
jgi:LPS export ABC transporter protein LptC